MTAPVLPEVRTIVTHDGQFHADEVLACAILRVVFPAARIVRTRDANTVFEYARDGATLVDVGGEYDGVTRFDHHQRGRAKKAACGIERSSAGLIWEAYGRAAVRRLISVSPEDADTIAEQVDRQLVLPIDAHDNGQALTSGELTYGIAPVSLSTVIAGMNPSWDDADTTHHCFEEATFLMAGILEAAFSEDQPRRTGGAVARGKVPRARSSPTRKRSPR